MNEIKLVLEAIRNGALNPGEVVIKTGLPRYEVLAVFHILEELNLIEPIYSKGSHKVYKLTKKGEEVLEGFEKGYLLDITMKPETAEQNA
ncbi:MAG: hypothetical protein OWQ54_08030 [Sulfolobaceae archaeon]|nr:hypothetical protein [Sulfolobaceae archaeon]